MAKDPENWSWDEECCQECGDRNYVHSRVPGVCKSCFEDPFDVTFHEEALLDEMIGEYAESYAER